MQPWTTNVSIGTESYKPSRFYKGEELTARFDLASAKSFATTNALFTKSTATVVAFIWDSFCLVDS